MSIRTTSEFCYSDYCMCLACGAGSNDRNELEPRTTCHFAQQYRHPGLFYYSRLQSGSLWSARLLVALLLIPFFGFPSNAQTQTTGAVQGVVLEEGTNAPVTGVVVLITNEETGLERSTLTDPAGRYFIGLLPVGLYTLRGQKDGFTESPFSLARGFQVRLAKENIVNPPPITLRRVGAAPAPPAAVPPPGGVTGADFARLVNTSNASRRANFDSRMLLALPSAGTRTFDSLALLAPGVAPPPAAIGRTLGPGIGSGVGTSGQFVVNGLRSRANNFTIDGSDNNDEDVGVRRQGFTSLLPQSIESIREFQITTLLAEPQFGRNMAGQVDAVSETGRKKFFGTVYGFLTDRRLRARDPFDLTGGPPAYSLRRTSDQVPITVSDLTSSSPSATAIILRNPVEDEDSNTRGIYGFVIGQPLFGGSNFFLSFEGQQINAVRESHFAVPTVAERGLFGLGDRGLVVTSTSGQQSPFFPTSVSGDAFFSLYPFANNPAGPFGENTFTAVLPANAAGAVASARIDKPNIQLFDARHTAALRYNQTNDRTDLPVTGDAVSSSLSAHVRTYNLAFILSTDFMPSLTNQFRFSYGRTVLSFDDTTRRCRSIRLPEHCLVSSGQFPSVPFLLNAPLLANATLPVRVGSQFVAGSPEYDYQGITTEQVTGPIGQVLISGFSPVGVDVLTFPQQRANNTFQTADTFIYQAGRHILTGGVDFRRTQLNSSLDRNFRPRATFSGAVDLAPQFGLQSFSPNGSYAGTDFVATGGVTGFFQTLALVPDSEIGLRYWQSDVFISDQYRADKGLTLTLGLRYELNTVPEEINRKIESTFVDPQVFQFIQTEKQLFGQSGFERFLAERRSIYRKDSNNVAPHIAFAWDPTGRGSMSIRGGYGIYFDQILGAVFSQSRSVFPTFVSLNLAGINPLRNGALIPFNPSLLARPGTLNTYNQAQFGADLVNFLVLLSRFTNPVPGGNSRSSNYPGGPGFVLPQFDLVTPYAQHWGLTVEKQFGVSILASAAYVGTKGAHLLRFATPNFGPNVFPVITGARGANEPQFLGFSIAPGPGGARTYPFLGSFTSIESDSRSSYHGLQLSLDRRFAAGFQFTSAYTWSHAIDEVSDVFDLAGAKALPQNSFNVRGERGNASFDIRHRFAASAIWELPWLRTSTLLGGWQVAGIATLESGQPYTVLAGFDVNLDGNLTDRLDNTNGITEVNDGRVRLRFPSGTAAQRQLVAATGSDGRVSRNSFRAQGLATLDASINKHFRFDERRDIELRVEFFNLFNRANYGIPVHQLGSPALGTSVNTRIPMRTVQIGARINF